MLLAGGLVATLATAAAVMSLTFANDSAAAVTGTGTQRVSVSTSGTQAQHDSDEPAMSADGRYVAFTTDEPFDPTDRLAVSQSTSGGTDAERRPDADIYVRDTTLDTTTLISEEVWTDEGGDVHTEPANGDSYQPTISGDGRFVAFATGAWNIAGDTTTPAIVVCDRDPKGTGTLGSTCRFTTITGNGEGIPSNPHLSADGRRISYDVEPYEVGFAARAAAATPPGDGYVEIVELRRGDDGTLTGPTDDDRTYVTAPEQLDINGAGHSRRSVGDSTMAAGGTHVAFVARYFHGETPDAYVVEDYDVGTGGLTRLDLDANGDPIAADGREFRHPALSGDGRRYAFTDVQEAGEVGVRLYDRDPDGDGTFGRPTVEIASRTPDGTDGQGDQAAFSADGRYLAFTTPTPGMHDGTDAATRESSCLGPGRDLSYCEIVVRDIVADAARKTAGLPRLPAELASPSATCVSAAKPCEGTGQSGVTDPVGEGGSGRVTDDGSPVLSADGSVIAYGSSAADLIDAGADTDDRVDVFRHRFQPALAAGPQDFGEVPLGAEVIRDVPVTQAGAGPTQVRSVTVDQGDFSVFPGESCTTVVLHAGEQCLVSVRFQPTVLGARTATLKLTFDGGDVPLSVPLTGTGTPVPVGAFSAGPAVLDFGARPVLRTSPVKSVTVRNTGTAPLRLRAVALSPTTFRGDYRISAGTCANRSLAAGATCRIDVVHRPTAVGVRPSALTVTYDGPDDSPLTFPVTLTGEGAAPTLVSSPTVTPAGRVIQITGTGFPPGSTAKLSLTGMPGATTAKASPGGNFRVPFVVLPNTWTGRHPLTAEVVPATAPGLSAPLTATLEFVIVPGSPLPPDFDSRN
jgi:hypothetical protein